MRRILKNHRSAPSPRRVEGVFLGALLQSVIGSATVFSIADQNPMYFILTMLGILLVWVVSVRPHRPAPRIIINTILLLVIVIAGIEMLRIGVGVSAFAVFVTLLMIVKLLDLREPRDDGQILVLSVAILVAAILTSNTLMTGVLMVIAIALLMRAVVLFQIHAVSRQTRSDSQTIGARTKVDIRSMLLATGFLCALIGSAIFVVLPRNIGAQAFGQWGVGRSVSGFSDSVELGRPGFISQSSIPVLDVAVSDRNGLNVGSENQPAVYLRGAVLTEYVSGRWTPSSVMRAPLSNRARLVPPNSSLTPTDAEDMGQWDRQYTITMRSSSDGPVYLFAPWKTVEFRVGDEPLRVGLDFERGIFLKDGIGGRIEYAVRTKNVEFDEIEYARDDQRNQVIPTLIEPEIAQLASEILVGAGIEPTPEKRPMSDDLAALRVIENYLRSRYTYTLDAQAVPAGEDATKWFLFERKTGHCEYYASALALMSRSIGVPARVVTGYVSSEYNSITAQNIVRESNAHAWIEAEIAPGQWRTYDGTPRADFHAIHEPDPSIWRSLAEMYESVEFLWVRTVVGFDSKSRQSIMGTTTTDFGLSRLSESLLNRLAAGRARLLTRGAIVAGIVFSLSMLLGMLILKNNEIIAGFLDGVYALLGRLRGRFLPSNSSASVSSYTRLEAIVSQCLDRLGIAKPDWTPLKAHLDQHRPTLDRASPPMRDAIFEASGLLYLHMFSQDPPPEPPERLARLESLLRKSEKCTPEER